MTARAARIRLHGSGGSCLLTFSKQARQPSVRISAATYARDHPLR
jgi:hypothetical protein